MGVGGLHSQEKNQSIRVGPSEYLTDLDVTSYYPSLILTLGLFPDHIGKKFLDVYRSIVDKRVSAKMAGDKVTADALKIVVNSLFGKFGNQYSTFYSPKLLLQTTITGQLYLLQLIELIELRTACKIVSANTDGITVYSPNTIQYNRMLSVSRQWEQTTRMELETTEYLAVFSQDVNNYAAVKRDGSIKGKGVFASGSLQKNPVEPIVQRATLELLTQGVPIEDTVHQCRDIRDFVRLRKVAGGAVYKDDEVGSTVRWYQSTKGSPIMYRKSGAKVPMATSARLVNDLPERFPTDIDYDYYIDAANTLTVQSGGLDTVSEHYEKTEIA